MRSQRPLQIGPDLKPAAGSPVRTRISPRVLARRVLKRLSASPRPLRSEVYPPRTEESPWLGVESVEGRPSPNPSTF